ncbi:MAG: hypothetical protein E6848_18700, partial [Bradyrhizobium sp.]|nr:hypothetical protein [Bradyrhizobium sp.]
KRLLHNKTAPWRLHERRAFRQVLKNHPAFSVADGVCVHQLGASALRVFVPIVAEKPHIPLNEYRM